MLKMGGPSVKRNPNKKMHYYQRDAVMAVEGSWILDDWTKSGMVIPPGGGKSFCTGELCARAIEEGGNALFLAHTKELVSKPKNDFEDDFGCRATIEMASQKADDSPMVFASVATMRNRIKSGKWRPDTFDRIIFDEGHRILAEGHQIVGDYFGQEGVEICACTGTPRRGDKKDLLQYLDGIAYDKPIQELFLEGFLIEPTIIHCPLGITIHQEKPSDVSDEEVSDAIEPYLEDAAEHVMKYAVGRCGLSFLPLRKTAMMFRDILRERGLKVEYVAGEGGENGVKVAEQKRIKRALEMGEIDHVVNAMLWSEGVDIRPLEVLVDLRPTMSWPNAIQKWCRLTRTWDPSQPYAKAWEGSRWGLKTHAYLLDFCFESERHSPFQRPAAIIAKDDEETELITKALKRSGGGSLMTALKSATNEREETLRKRLEAMRHREARTVSALDYFLRQRRMDLVDYEPHAKWEMEPVTEEQSKVLVQAGIDVSSLQGKGHAVKVLDVVVDRIKKGMATTAQASYCEALGHPDPWNITFDQARVWLDANAKNKRR